MKAALYSGSRNIYPDMITSAKSLAANSDVDRIYMLIEDNDMGDVPDYVKCINVSGQLLFRKGTPNMKSGFTYFAMMRAALALLPELDELDRILSLDADTIVMQDVSDVWNLPINQKGNECYFAATHEWHRTKNGLMYCNTGVALYNLEFLRKTGKAKEVIDCLNRRRYPWVEQDVFNYLCQGRIYDMPAEYNANDWTEWNLVKILHFAGKNDWRDEEAVVKWRNTSWEEVEKIRSKRC